MEGIVSTYPILVGSVIGTFFSVLMDTMKRNRQIFGGNFNKDVDTAIFSVNKHSNGKYYYTVKPIFYGICYSIIGCLNSLDIIKHVITHFLLSSNPTILTYTITSHIISNFTHYMIEDNKSINFGNLALHLLYATCYVLGGKSLWIPVISESIQNIVGVSLHLKFETNRIKRIIFKNDDIPSEINEEDYNKLFPSN